MPTHHFSTHVLDVAHVWIDEPGHVDGVEYKRLGECGEINAVQKRWDQPKPGAIAGVEEVAEVRREGLQAAVYRQHNGGARLEGPEN